MVANKEHCGTITYLSKQYDVSWDAESLRVYISQLNNPSVTNVHFPGYLSENKANAADVALRMLNQLFGE